MAERIEVWTTIFLVDKRLLVGWKAYWQVCPGYLSGHSGGQW